MPKLSIKRIKDGLFTCVSIILGNAALAFMVEAFVIPHGIIMGGVTGLGLILNRVIPLDTAVIVLVLNLFALLLCIIMLGKKVFVTTVASSFLYPFFLVMMRRIPGISTITDNPLFAIILGAGLFGIGVGLVLRVGASTGGIEIVNLVLHKWFHLPISVLVYLTDFVILCGQAVFSQPKQILYGILLLLIGTIILDRVMIFGRSQIQIFAISPQYEKIRQSILTELQAGATMIAIETGCARQKQQGVLCIIPSRKLYAAKELIQSIDPDTFMTITQIKEVRGRGFTLERKEFHQIN